MKNHINIGTLILLAALSFVSFSCSNLFSTTGSITFALPATTTARSAENGVDCSTSDASTYEVTLTAPNNGETKTMTGNPGGSISIEELDPGTWTVSCRALNSKNVCIGCGKTDVSVEAGRTTEVNLALYLNATNTITSLYIHSNPAKTTYAAGDTLSLDGLTFSAQFANGNTAILSKDELALTTTPAEGEAIATDCTSVSVSYKSADTSYSLTIPLSVNADAPAITGEQKGSYFSAGTASDLVSCTASCIEGGALSFAWYVSDSEYGAGSSLSSDSYSTVENDSGSYTSTLKTKPEKAGTFYYYCIVTNKNEKVNGATSTTTTSSYYKIEFIAGSVTSFTAALASSSTYLIEGDTPSFDIFTVTETWTNTDKTTTTHPGQSSDYSISLPETVTSAKSAVGDIPVTLTRSSGLSSDAASQSVTVTFKYKVTSPIITTSVQAVSEAQYTGTTTFTATVSNTPHNLYKDGKTTVFYDTVTYAWKSSASSTSDGASIGTGTGTSTGTKLINASADITYPPSVDTAGTSTYTLTASITANSEQSAYCDTSTADSVSKEFTATVTAWTITCGSNTVTDGGKITYTEASTVTISAKNSNDTSSTIAATCSTSTGFSISGTTLTIPASGTTEASTTITVTAGGKTIATFTVASDHISSITAALNNGSLTYITTDQTISAALFTITETYNSGTSKTVTGDEAKTAYSVKGYTSGSNEVGTFTFTITNSTSTSLTCTVSVPVEYTSVTPQKVTITSSDTDNSIAQYTGSVTLTASCGTFTSYSYTVNGETATVLDDVAYQWYSATSTSATGTALADATSATYTPTATSLGTTYYYAVLTTKCNGGTTLCSNSTETLSATTERTAITVTPWTTTLTDTKATSPSPQSISSGGTVALTAGDKYTMSFANDNAGDDILKLANSSATWTISDSSFGSSFTSSSITSSGTYWSFTAPAATTSAQSATFTATYGSYTLGSFTATVAASTSTTASYTAGTYTDLATAISAISTNNVTDATITITNSFEMTGCVNISANVIINSDTNSTSGYTLSRGSTFTSGNLFFVNSGYSLTLGSDGGNLILDGGYTTNTIKPSKSLIYASNGDLTIGSKCTVQNNCSSGDTGGGIYVYTTSRACTLIVNGTITGNTTTGGPGGGIYINAKASFPVTLTMNNAKITNNTASTHGGGLCIKNGSGTLADVTITGNTASYSTDYVGGGGGIYYSASSCTLNITSTGTSALIDSNTATKSGGGIYINGGTVSINPATLMGTNTGTSGYGPNVYVPSGSTYIIAGTTQTGTSF
jgi:hypothetical protein